MSFFAKVVAAYNAESSQEMSVYLNEVLEITEINDDGWAWAKRGAVSAGWIPKDFIERVSAPASLPDPPVLSPLIAPITPSVDMTNSCGGCLNQILDSFIVADDIKFHPQCFKCCTCHKALGGQLFIAHEGKVYCEADYATRFNPRCGHCNELIVGEYIMAMDKAWHPDHFVCTKCQCQLQGVCHQKDGKPYCATHFAELNSCARCGIPIEGQMFEALDKKYHPGCFLCAHGDHAIEAGTSFNVYQDKLYCNPHFTQLFVKTCNGCNQIITSQYMKVGDLYFHPNCWKCKTCSKVLSASDCLLTNVGCFCKMCGLPSQLTSPPVASAAPKSAPTTPTPDPNPTSALAALPQPKTNPTVSSPLPVETKKEGKTQLPIEETDVKATQKAGGTKPALTQAKPAAAASGHPG
jgi:hypothetical protein